MTDAELLERLKRWVDFSILNQQGLLEEFAGIGDSGWNKGYLECLNDVAKILMRDETPLIKSMAEYNFDLGKPQQ